MLGKYYNQRRKAMQAVFDDDVEVILFDPEHDLSLHPRKARYRLYDAENDASIYCLSACHAAQVLTKLGYDTTRWQVLDECNPRRRRRRPSAAFRDRFTAYKICRIPHSF